MTTTFSTTAFSPTTRTSRLISLFGRYRDDFLQWRRRGRLRRDLCALDDRELRDIAIARGEIDYVVSGHFADLREGTMNFKVKILTTGLVLCLLNLAPAVGADVKQASVNGKQFAYVEAGQGDPVVLVHGGLQDYRFWNSHLAVFAKTHRVIAYSRQNHFPNATSKDGLPDGAADLHGEDLAALLAALGITSAHIVAHSSGAHAALFFAANHPEAVRTLVINEPPAAALLAGVPGGDDVLKQWGARFAPARQAFEKDDLNAGLRLFAEAIGGPGTYDRRSESERKMMADNALSAVADAITTRPRPVFTCDMAKRISAPTLVTNGDRSPEFFHRIVNELVRCLPRRTRVEIAGSSHTVPGEAPQAYDEAVLSFIASH
ncbi:alpha/beta fold hydrolase [Bradyrhizobium guangzhouense]|nr:alpha/beta fold hydrolase [Bradyrhizobium guangzhouense]